MRSWWAFPPSTQKVQLDEKWSFVAKKQKNCKAEDEADWFKGDQWDHVALDPDHLAGVVVLHRPHIAQGNAAAVAIFFVHRSVA